jgi:hypothetical protein
MSVRARALLRIMTTIRGFDFPDELYYLLEHDA